MSDTKNNHHELIYCKARLAGLEAAKACNPNPMIVDGRYFVAGGACGFAWVNIKPGTSSFAKWLIANGHGRKDSYYGGVTVWVSEFGQSMETKEAFARAFADVLNADGITAYSHSRMD